MVISPLVHCAHRCVRARRIKYRLMRFVNASVTSTDSSQRLSVACVGVHDQRQFGEIAERVSESASLLSLRQVVTI